MLQTQLQHLESRDQAETVVNENKNVMICCGRMGPMCVPVYSSMHMLEQEGDYDHVVFHDMEFDIPDAAFIRELPECAGFMGLPFTAYFRDGKPVHATSSIQSKEQIEEILDREFGE